MKNGVVEHWLSKIHHKTCSFIDYFFSVLVEVGRNRFHGELDRYFLHDRAHLTHLNISSISTLQEIHYLTCMKIVRWKRIFLYFLGINCSLANRTKEISRTQESHWQTFQCIRVLYARGTTSIMVICVDATFDFQACLRQSERHYQQLLYVRKSIETDFGKQNNLSRWQLKNQIWVSPSPERESSEMRRCRVTWDWNILRTFVYEYGCIWNQKYCINEKCWIGTCPTIESHVLFSHRSLRFTDHNKFVSVKIRCHLFPWSDIICKRSDGVCDLIEDLIMLQQRKIYCSEITVHAKKTGGAVRCFSNRSFEISLS